MEGIRTKIASSLLSPSSPSSLLIFYLYFITLKFALFALFAGKSFELQISSFILKQLHIKKARQTNCRAFAFFIVEEF